jgi:hypothetical protein
MNIDFDRALEWLTTRPMSFTPIHNTTRTYGFALRNGRQLAIKPLRTQITVFAEPGSWETQATRDWALCKYSPSDGRSSHLKTCAPRLDVGRPAVSLGLKRYEDFEKFIASYVSVAALGTI